MSKLSSEALLAAKRRLLDEDDFTVRKKLHKDEEKRHKKKNKKEKKSKKKKKSKSSSESSESSDSEAWVEAPSKHSDPSKINDDYKPASAKSVVNEKHANTDSLKRDDWMTMTGMFATFTREDIRPKRDNKKKNIDDYDPGKSVRELNPYWKDGGKGLPSEDKSQKPMLGSSRTEYSRSSNYSRQGDFKKPSYGDDDRSFHRRDFDNDSGYKSSRKNWRIRRESPERRRDNDSGKRRDNDSGKRRDNSPEWRRNSSERRRNSQERRRNSLEMKSNSPERRRDTYQNEPSSSYSQPGLSSNQHKPEDNESQNDEKTPYLTDQQMNEIGAKIVKAEIMGNTKLVAKLTAKLNAAREYRKEHPEAGKKDDAVMLTLTDEKGNVRPLTKMQQVGDPRSKGGKKKATTHAVTGERTRFFEDDDKYSLTQMFERERFGNSHDAEKEFADAISKHKNPNDDLDDIFAERITKTKSDAKIDEQNKRKAISQHKTVQKSLENCEYCIDSDKMLKHLIVSLGSKAYIALPSRKSLTEGHCYIATIGHVTCSTMADEDVWNEVMTYRRALTRLFSSRDEDVVFFETATHFHKYPHLVINCVPLPRDVGDSAPIYFKKAIMECEMEWSNNKKLVDLRGKDIRKGVPQRLPYFWVDFGMDPGFAHVIEDQNLFPNNFAQEIVGGMLDLDHTLWRKPHRENFDSQRKKVLEFEKIWKEFDPKPT